MLTNLRNAAIDLEAARDAGVTVCGTGGLGYPTAEHFEALARLGPSPHHRRTFRLRIEDTSQMKLF